MFPHLSTLCLTNLPAKVRSESQLAAQLIALLKSCATESYWSRARAAVDYALPPGRQREEAQRRRAKSLFGLERIVLEVVAGAADPRYPVSGDEYNSRRTGTNSGQGATKTATKTTATMLSPVEDADCDTLWSAARDDFSFFHEDTEECGLPLKGEGIVAMGQEDKIPVLSDADGTTAAMGTSTHQSISSSRSRLSAQHQQQQPGLSLSAAASTMLPSPLVDVVAEVAKFRREARRKWVEESSVAVVGDERWRDGRGGGGSGGRISDHWDGDLTVVRLKWP